MECGLCIWLRESSWMRSCTSCIDDSFKFYKVESSTESRNFSLCCCNLQRIFLQQSCQANFLHERDDKRNQVPSPKSSSGFSFGFVQGAILDANRSVIL